MTSSGPDARSAGRRRAAARTGKRPDSRPTLVLTCEHGGCEIPAEWRPLFAGKRAMLESHRGRDQGALEMAEELAARFRAPLFPATVSRLLVDLNRSLHHPSVFSELTRDLPEAERTLIVARHYRPHRERIEAEIRNRVGAGGTVVHVAVHSFTPVRKGVVREADVSLLYDPRRPGEKRLCDAWAASMARARPDLRIRRNYPFKGISDGLTTHLRKLFPASRYIGIEIESNQRFVRRGGKAWKSLRQLVAETLAEQLG